MPGTKTVIRPLLAVCVLWSASVSAQAAAIDFSRYHTVDDINQYMRATVSANPTIARHDVLGYSAQGREIGYLIVSKGDPSYLPAIYVNGTHHGDEKSSTESVLGFTEHLITNQADPVVNSLLESYAFYLQPLVNPDGHAAHTRDDSLGRDPNRDYSYPDRPDQDSFRIQEIRLVKELADRVRFRAAAALHSGMEGILWPWCWTGQKPPDFEVFQTISRLTAQAMGMRKWQQSYLDYATRGEFIDHLYMAHNTLAVTFEVSNALTPPVSQLRSVVSRAVAGLLTFVRAIQDLDHGGLAVDRMPQRAEAGGQVAGAGASTAPLRLTAR